MSKLRFYLTGLLLLQLFVFTGLTLSSQLSQQSFQPEPLLAFDPAMVDRLVVSDGTGQVTLQKSDGRWTLPDLDNLPVDSGRLDTVIDELSGLKTSWPVTTTVNSHDRFEVATNHFKRRIQLYNGDKLAGELYLGTSPGFKKTHGRVAGQGNVYTLGLNTYDLPMKESDWLDKNLLSVSDISAIRGPDYLLEKADSEWLLKEPDGTTVQGSLNQDSADAIAKTFIDFRVINLASRAPEFTPGKTLTLDVTGSSNWHYQLLHDGDDYFVKRSDRSEAFKISQFEYDQVAAIDMAKLTATAGQVTTATPAG